MAKVVLLSYLERNKKLSIPEEKGQSDVEYLRREFIHNFEFEKNVKLQITFQQFEPEWSEYVDLEEDAVVGYKDKLEVIVIPRLSDSSTSTLSSVVTTVPLECGSEREVTLALDTNLHVCTIE